ncbi:methyltransferase domain-containing protein [Streptomyces sp. ACA25]|uniref:methyltransferase domain-containing protein n=1 Tax=Streptomyces sp. ACA25 TaxID=3022596 RepID=UPI002306FB55|nr:methyltransferase domain-containing protein [Streptomyces sp. ACA25]MDB1086599.1 methyltransferase domain-containing protein [Streptomyces sp. ACA25]
MLRSLRSPHPPLRPNDPALYEHLADHWWRPRGKFAMLHWLAAARGRLVPPAGRPGAVLVDLGCGAGLLAPHLAGKGYRHLGVDLSETALRLGRDHGMQGVQGDVLAVPLADGCADVVVAGEILEHVPDLPAAVSEACRLLRPGGLLVIDTLADTALCRGIAIHLGERLPGIAPRGVHDPALLVDRVVLTRECARHGVHLTMRGIRPSMSGLLAWAVRRRSIVRMVPVPTTAVLFQARGRKED